MGLRVEAAAQGGPPRQLALPLVVVGLVGLTAAAVVAGAPISAPLMSVQAALVEVALSCSYIPFPTR
jgi:hypothetical protein